MTKDQQEAMEQAKKILLGSFDSFIICTRCTNENNVSHFPASYHGQLSDVRGLLAFNVAIFDADVVRHYTSSEGETK